MNININRESNDLSNNLDYFEGKSTDYTYKPSQGLVAVGQKGYKDDTWQLL